MADQRADTPRLRNDAAEGVRRWLLTRSGTNPIWDAFDEALSIERAIGRAEAAAEPAAAEPPDALDLLRDWIDGWRGRHPSRNRQQLAEETDRLLERAAQPPRGSLPDRATLQRWFDEWQPHGPAPDGMGTYVACTVSKPCEVHAYLAGGSLTATAQQQAASDEPPIVPGTNTRVHFSPPGSPRGVTVAADRPALDVERLALALRRSLKQRYTQAWRTNAAIDAERVAAEYTRLGSEPAALPKSPALPTASGEDSDD